MEFNFDEVINRSRDLVQRSKDLSAKTTERKSQLEQKVRGVLESPTYSTANTSPRGLPSPLNQFRRENALLKKQLLELHEQTRNTPVSNEPEALARQVEEVSRRIAERKQDAERLQRENQQLQAKLTAKNQLQARLLEEQQKTEVLKAKLDARRDSQPGCTQETRMCKLEKKLRASNKLLRDLEKRFKRLKC